VPLFTNRKRRGRAAERQVSIPLDYEGERALGRDQFQLVPCHSHQAIESRYFCHGRFEIMPLFCLIVADRTGTHRGGHFPDTIISQRDARDRKDFN